MTSLGYLTHQDGVVAMPEAEAQPFQAFLYDFLAILDFAQRATGLFPEVEQAVRTGAGPPERLLRGG